MTACSSSGSRHVLMLSLMRSIFSCCRVSDMLILVISTATLPKTAATTSAPVSIATIATAARRASGSPSIRSPSIILRALYSSITYRSHGASAARRAR